MLQVVEFSTSHKMTSMLIMWFIKLIYAFMLLLNTNISLVDGQSCVAQGNIIPVASYCVFLLLPSPSTSERNGFQLGHPHLISKYSFLYFIFLFCILVNVFTEINTYCFNLKTRCVTLKIRRDRSNFGCIFHNQRRLHLTSGTV